VLKIQAAQQSLAGLVAISKTILK